MVWYFIGVYIIKRTLHGRLEIRNFSSRVEKIFPTLEEKFRISARPCNILYLLMWNKWNNSFFTPLYLLLYFWCDNCHLYFFKGNTAECVSSKAYRSAPGGSGAGGSVVIITQSIQGNPNDKILVTGGTPTKCAWGVGGGTPIVVISLSC